MGGAGIYGVGGAGNDSLVGDAGLDTFLFDAPLNAAGNVDRVADFNVADDGFRLWQVI
jgi:Ca2+-binding RTX toxin-like protein